ncbi:hypothetical protein ACJX0J_021954, partial [Zea mays]
RPILAPNKYIMNSKSLRIYNLVGTAFRKSEIYISNFVAEFCFFLRMIFHIRRFSLYERRGFDGYILISGKKEQF